jgi:hypothetical protein
MFFHLGYTSSCSGFYGWAILKLKLTIGIELVLEKYAQKQFNMGVLQV